MAGLGEHLVRGTAPSVVTDKAPRKEEAERARREGSAGPETLRRGILRHRRLEQREIPAVPLRLQAVDRNESQGRRVHAVAQSRRRGAVVETVAQMRVGVGREEFGAQDRKSTRLNSSHGYISYAGFCLEK